MRRLIFLIVLCCAPVIAFNQIADEINSINVDSLKKVLPELNEINKIDALNKIALAISMEDPDSSLSLAKRAISMAEELDYQKALLMDTSIWEMYITSATA